MDRGASVVNVRLATLDNVEALISLRILRLEVADAGSDTLTLPSP